MQQPLLDVAFSTLSQPNPVFCHQEFLEKLQGQGNLPVAKRASLLMQRLAVDSRRQHYKSTKGVNQGWRRSRLGGGGGNQFYAWWAPKAAQPLRGADGFEEAPDDAIFLRDIRHHDDHSPAHANSFQEHYLPVSVLEMRQEDYAPAPWTQQQQRFAAARQPIRVLKGHPGSGKTTALLHAADTCGARRVLYLTYSRDLAVLAREYFERYCSSERQFHVLTFDAFLRRLAGEDAPHSNYVELRRRFRADLSPFSRSLGPWTDRPVALYDEFHAHVVGAAIPAAAGRFSASRQPRVSKEDYRDRRLRYLGNGAVSCVLDVAARMERSDPSLAERYFPELLLAWKVATRLAAKDTSQIGPEFEEFDCVAVDECQDLTPIEAFVVVELAASLGRKKHGGVPVLLAGDEAQTVRPTDFEWGWMNDILHSRVGTPSEFKLSSNLRSPRSIATLVNQVWNLYAEVEQRDRPSGTGFAEIDDDATDQVLYCTASPGEELERLLKELAAREGLAMVAYDDSVLQTVPEAVRSSILTASEVKGLDFHTVCLINAGQHLERIVRWSDELRFSAAEIESIRRRLAIDELRVGISRPADRLIWLDITPSGRVVQATLSFLNRSLDGPFSPSVPSALLTALEEEQLDLEERIQRCQTDARQFLDIRPEVAWSRAQQAVALLGDSFNPMSVRDESVRKSARGTLAEICFCLGFRRTRLAPELGHPDLFREAAMAAARPGLAAIIRDIGVAVRADHDDRLPALGDLAQTCARYKDDLEPWILTEIAPKIVPWIDELESAIAIRENAVTLAHVLPPFYGALRLPDAADRAERLRDRCVRHLLKSKRHEKALEILRMLPDRRPELEAECLESTGRHVEAAELYCSIGRLKEALTCYRAAPDFAGAAALIRGIPDHPASDAYQWLMRLKEVLDQRPANFSRVMTPPEKKILEQMLEQGLGVARKRPAPRKAASKKTPAPRNPRAKRPSK